MKPEFYEDCAPHRVNPNVDPLADTHAEFDWDELDRRLGEESEDPNDFGDLAAMLRVVLHWMLDTDMSARNAERMIGRRAIALAWVINPGLFQGGPSMTELAKRLKLHPRTMQRLGALASERFGITNRAQQHGWNRGLGKNRRTKAPTMAQKRVAESGQGVDSPEAGKGQEGTI